MRFGVLGPLEVDDGGQQVPLGGRRHLEVLAMLLVEPGHPVSADRMVTELWGDDGSTRSVKSLYTHISNLRRSLGRERIVHDAAGYRLVLVDGDEVDEARFDALIDEARQLSTTDTTAAVERLDTALGLWRGKPFEGLDDVGALVPAMARLDEARTSAELERFELQLRSGAVPEIVEVEDLCRRNPLDERPWGILMRTLYRSGRQVEALRTFRRVQELLGEELGVAPSPRLARIEEQILLHDPDLDGDATRPPSALPSYLTTFVGRDRERTDLIDALRRHRLVTLTGPGGVGKTRLAVEVASRLEDTYPDGIWMIDLATIASDRDVGPAIAAAVGAPGGADVTAATAAAALNGRRCLVILDNCEHLLDATRESAVTLLTGAPDLTVLATSRVALEVAGEHRLGLDGLESSDDDGSFGDAGALFLGRARAIRPDLDIDADATAAIGAVCSLLDGIPLALELAAARSDVLSPVEIADLLAHRRSVLFDATREREIHRSLEATIGWSYGLLDADQRAEFATLGIFEGPFTADAAGAVLGRDATAAIETIHRLVTASLVHPTTEPGRPTHYRLLDTLKHYARDRLIEAGRWGMAAARHDRHYVARSQALADQLLVRHRPEALRRIAEAEGELSAAWERLLQDDPAEALPIAWVLGNHWLDRGGIAEGEQRIKDLLERTTGTGGRWRMLGLTVGSWIAARRGAHQDALAWSDEAVALAERSGDPTSVIVALNHAGQLRVDLGEHDQAIDMFDRSLREIARIEHAGHAPPELADGRAWTQVGRAEAGRWSGEPTPQVRDALYEAHRHFVDVGEPEGRVRTDRVLVTMPDVPYQERLRLAREMTDVAAASGRAQLRFEAAWAMSILSWESGDQQQALVMNRAATRTAAASGSLTEIGSALLDAARFLVGEQPERAARLIGAGRRFCTTTRGPHAPADLDVTIDEARQALGDDRFEELCHLGSMMAMPEAVALVTG